MNTLFFRSLLVCSILIPAAHAADPAVASAPAAVAASAPAKAAEAVPSKEEVTKAITVLENDFLGPKTPLAAQTVMQFAQYSKDVTMALSPKTTPWVFGDKQAEDAAEAQLRSMLFAAYLAGNTKAQLASGSKADNPLAGWQFTLKCYTAFQKKHKLKIAELETLKAQQAKGQLPMLAKKSLQK